MALNLRKDDEPITDPGKKEINLTKTNLNGMTICLTGTIPGMTRTTAMDRIKKKFPKVTFTDHVYSYTDCLITGHGVGQTKLKAAQKYNIPIIESSTILS